MASILRYYKGVIPLPPMVPDAAIDALKTFKYRHDDILIASYPKSGTHWINEVTQLILHNGDPKALDHRHRRACLEIKDTTNISKISEVKSAIEVVDTDPSPRVLMTHLPPSYLSEETWKKRIPIICVFRDPRDVVLSFFEFGKDFVLREGVPLYGERNFEGFLKEFVEGKVSFGGWCEHATSYEALLEKGENILFITYEDMNKNLPKVIKTVATHLGRDVTGDVIQNIVINTTKEAMLEGYKEATKTKDEYTVDLSVYIKTGVAGRWKTDYPENQWNELNKIFKEKVKDSTFAKQYFEY